MCDMQEQEEYVGVWEIWERYKRGRAIVKSKIHAGNTVYLINRTKSGFWKYTPYKVIKYELLAEPCFESLGSRKERVIIHNDRYGTRVIPIYEIGHTVFTTMMHARREVSTRNSEIKL